MSSPNYQQNIAELVAVVVNESVQDKYGDIAATLVQRSGLNLFSSLVDAGDDYPYALVYADTGLALHHTAKGAPKPISADFNSGKSKHRRLHGGGNGQLVAKAVGIASGIRPRVLDATAGLGRDAFVLASLGCEVEMMERSPIVASLLVDAIAQAQSSDDFDLQGIAHRMSFVEGDAIAHMQNHTGYVSDVIYLDPMYPEREKSAAVKKEMRAFHDIVGANLDDAQLLEAALEKAEYRVVVKRPRKGEEIEGVKPSMQVVGKSSRYDIYTRKSLSYLKA